MTRIAIDTATALRLIEEGTAIRPGDSLVGPGVLRSHALSALYRAVREGELEEKAARTQLEGVAGLKIRLLGDRVSRSTAFVLARRLDEPDTGRAEYLAVASLQADVLVAADPELAALAAGIVPIATFESAFG